MNDHQMYDLYRILIATRMEPTAIPAKAYARIAALCRSGTEDREAFRRCVRESGAVGRACVFAELDDCEAVSRGTSEEQALMADIFHTAFVLCREGNLSALRVLADAAHNFPLSIIRRDVDTIPYLRSEMQYFTELTGLELLSAADADEE